VKKDVEMLTSEIRIQSRAIVESPTVYALANEVAETAVKGLRLQSYSAIHVKIGQQLILVQADKKGIRVEKIYNLNGGLLLDRIVENGSGTEVYYDSDGYELMVDTFKDDTVTMVKANTKMMAAKAAQMKSLMTTASQAMANLYPGYFGAHPTIT